jgi:hypothetical protein
MSAPIIDWKAVRLLNGSRNEGFEELCAQLARSENPSDSYFERKGAPDAGVACYTIPSDGREWDWQAKYFDSLGDPQWKNSKYLAVLSIFLDILSTSSGYSQEISRS